MSSLISARECTLCHDTMETGLLVPQPVPPPRPSLAVQKPNGMNRSPPGSVPHFGNEVTLRSLGLKERSLQSWMEAERGGESGKKVRIRTITDWGLTEVFEMEGRMVMGKCGSPHKYIGFADGLLRWLDACGVK